MHLENSFYDGIFFYRSEILQEIILLGLDRSGFFEKTAFYGGTPLRIMYGLDRFSEDLDFTLLKPDPKFKLDKYFPGLEWELKAFGFEFSLQRVEKSEERTTESAFLKASTQILFLNIHGTKGIAESIHKGQTLKVKVKFEVDIDPATSTQLRRSPCPHYLQEKCMWLSCASGRQELKDFKLCR